MSQSPEPPSSRRQSPGAAELPPPEPGADELPSPEPRAGEPSRVVRRDAVIGVPGLLSPRLTHRRSAGPGRRGQSAGEDHMIARGSTSTSQVTG